MMDYVALHLKNSLMALIIIFLFDKLIASNFMVKSLKNRDYHLTRWFRIHAFGNFLACITAVPSLLSVLRDPYNSMNTEHNYDRSLFGNASIWPLTIINVLHIYHMTFPNLSDAEKFHHLLFIPTLGLTGQVCEYGALSNWQAFFISGLPGGIDYLILSFVKQGKFSKVTQKRICANLNVWVRCPGILVSTIYGYQAFVTGNYSCPSAALIIQLILPPYNALIYCKEAVANYAVHYMLQDQVIAGRVKERTSKMTGKTYLDWNIKVPQRGS